MGDNLPQSISAKDIKGRSTGKGEKSFGSCVCVCGCVFCKLFDLFSVFDGLKDRHAPPKSILSRLCEGILRWGDFARGPWDFQAF